MKAAYKTFVRPQLDYAAHSLHPFIGTQMEVVDKVQTTASRVTCSQWRNINLVESRVGLTNLIGHPLRIRRVKSY